MKSKTLSQLWSTISLLVLITLNMGCATVAAPTASTPLQSELHAIPEANCSINVRRMSDATDSHGPLFIAVNGVPTTALVYQPLAEALVEQLNATVLLIDLPGTGASRLKDSHYNWTTQRACLQAFLRLQPSHTLIIHDVAGPVLLPILGELPTLKQLVVFNTLLKPSDYSLPFPLNCLRSCLFLSKPLAYAAPFWFYENRFRAIGITDNATVSQQQIRDIYNDLRKDQGMGRLVEVLKGFELTTQADMAIAAGLADTRPQLFIWGMQDPALGEQLNHLAMDNSQRQIHKLSQAKHFPMLDYADESAAAIVTWHQQLPR